ncbi:MAG TPA: hypothetical protein VNL91_11070, partial [Thermoanaerobaculia bacterium]|nr:hypothetical protein [Thermoanaerobaculia bacterium]
MTAEARAGARPAEWAVWIAGVAVAVVALAVARGAIGEPTPIDRALPVIAAAVALLAWIAGEPAIAGAVPLLVAASIAFPDERRRLFAYGLIVAVAFCAACRPASHEKEGKGPAAVLQILIGLVILRWLHLPDAGIVREALVAAGALAVMAAFRFRRAPLP